MVVTKKVTQIILLMNNKLLLILLMTGLLSACNAEYTGVYQNVTAESKWDESARIVINNSTQAMPLFKVVDEKLYLMIQLTQVDWFIRSIVTYPSWDKTEMKRLLETHNNLKSMVPVAWDNWLPRWYGDECKPK